MCASMHVFMCLCVYLCVTLGGDKRTQKSGTFKENMSSFHTHAYAKPHKQTHASPHTHKHKQAIIIPLLQRCSISRDQSPGDLALPNTLRKSAENHLSSPSIFPHFPSSPSLLLLFIFVYLRLPSRLHRLSPEVSAVLSCSLLSMSLSWSFPVTLRRSSFGFVVSFFNSSMGSSISQGYLCTTFLCSSPPKKNKIFFPHSSRSPFSHSSSISLFLLSITYTVSQQ